MFGLGFFQRVDNDTVRIEYTYPEVLRNLYDEKKMIWAMRARSCALRDDLNESFEHLTDFIHFTHHNKDNSRIPDCIVLLNKQTQALCNILYINELKKHYYMATHYDDGCPGGQRFYITDNYDDDCIQEYSYCTAEFDENGWLYGMGVDLFKKIEEYNEDKKYIASQIKRINKINARNSYYHY